MRIKAYVHEIVVYQDGYGHDRQAGVSEQLEVNYVFYRLIHIP